MWGSFAVAVIVQAVFLFLPGCLLLRALGVQRILSVACAPVISTALYFAWSEILVALGVFCSWTTVGLPIAIATLGAWLVGRFRRKVCDPFVIPDGLAGRRGWFILLLFAAVGILAGIYALLSPLSSPDNFIQAYDNKSHLANLWGFVQSGNWSAFKGSFYPSGWSLDGALTSSVLGTSSALTENALDFVFACLALPWSMMALLAVLTRGSVRVLIYGAFLTVAFVAFPWGILMWGPLMPNTAAFCVVPALVALFLEWAQALRCRAGRRRRALLVLLAVIGCGILHPSSLFTAFVFVVPYCLQRLYGSRVRVGRLRALCRCTAFLAAVCGVWVIMFNLPFLQSTVTYVWDPARSVPDALYDIVLFRMPNRVMQPVLAILVLVGFVWAVAHRPQRWLAVSCIVFGIMLVIDSSTEGFAKQLLTGFWYTDRFRIAACLVLSAIPLAALGAAALDGLVRGLFARLGPHRVVGRALTCAGCALIVFTVYAPQRLVGEPFRVSDVFAFDDLRLASHLLSSGDLVVYDDDERAFVRRVVDVVGDSLVINSPDDGTLLARGAEGLNIYYTAAGNAVTDVSQRDPHEPYESWLIRARLKDIASDQEVRDALASAGAEYLVMLDQGTLEDQPRYLSDHRVGQYPGIDSIRDDTPGFEVVLAEGDMRLYRIVA